MNVKNIVPNDEFNVIIGKNCVIGSYNKILDSAIQNNSLLTGNFINNTLVNNNATVKNSVVENSEIGFSCVVGVFSHLRPNSKLLKNVKIGNFVETKNCLVGNNTKASHLTYIGDAEIGENVNVGCGTIFCNYNGKIKQKTIVKNNVFIGSNSNLVAPIVVNENSFIAAGSTITNNVPKNTLAIARSKQINKEDYYKE